MEIGGPYYLTAGPFSCKYYRNVRLKFARWLNTDVSGYTDVKIEISHDQSNWITVWRNSNTPITDNSWNQIEVDIGPVADDQESVYIRWNYAVADHAYPFSGWNLDDISLWGTPK